MAQSNFFRQYRAEIEKMFTLLEMVKTFARAVSTSACLALVLHLTGQGTFVNAYIKAHQVQLFEAGCLYALLRPFVRFLVNIGAGIGYSIVKVFVGLLPPRSQVQA